MERRSVKTQDWGPARWLKDGSGYTTLEKSETVQEAKDIVDYDPETGRREVLVLASNLLARGESKPLKIEDYAWSDDGAKLLLFTNTKRVWRKETRGDYWVFDRRSRELTKLGGKAAPATLMFGQLIKFLELALPTHRTIHVYVDEPMPPVPAKNP